MNPTESININLLKPSSFYFNVKSLPKTSFHIQSVNIPGFTSAPIPVPSPFHDFPVPGEKLYYEPLEISFLVDEDLGNYEEIQKWLIGITFPKEYAEYREQFSDGIYSDIELSILTNNSNHNISIVYTDCFPVSISGIQMTTTENDVNVIVASAQFNFGGLNMNN